MIKEDVRGYRFIGIFVLGFVLFNYPLLSLFNFPKRLWGIPLLYAYLFIAWLLLILLPLLVSRTRRSSFDNIEIEGD